MRLCKFELDPGMPVLHHLSLKLPHLGLLPSQFLCHLSFQDLLILAYLRDVRFSFPCHLGHSVAALRFDPLFLLLDESEFPVPRYRLVVGFLFPHVDDAQSVMVLGEHSLLQLLATS